MSAPVLIHHSGWPWPLDMVQDWFDSLWSNISNWFQSVASWVWERIPDNLKTFVGFLGDLSRTIWDGFVSFFKDPLGTLKSAFDTVGTAVWDAGGWLVGQITTGLSGLWSKIEPALINAWSSIQGFSSFLSGAINSGLGWLKGALWGWIDGALKWASDSFKWLNNQINSAGAWVVNSVSGTIGNIVPAITNFVSGAMSSVASGLGQGLSSFWTWLVEAGGVIADLIMGGARWIRDRIIGPVLDFGREMAQGLLDAVLPGSPDKKTTDTVKLFAENYIDRMSELIPTKSSPLPSLSDLLVSSAGVVGLNVLAFLGGESVGLALDQAHPLKNIGFRQVASDLVQSFAFPQIIGPLLSSPLWPGLIMPLRYRMSAQYPNMIPDIRDAQTMLWRRAISIDEFREVVSFHGFGRPFAEGYEALTRQLPGSQDLITFMVREVILESDFLDNMAMQGFSVFWANAYYEAHWRLPSAMNVTEAFHRGNINEDERDLYFKWLDYRPDPRPGIEKSDIEIMSGIQKTLIPRVDTRYAWEMGFFDDDDLEAHYVKLGYEEEAPLMASIQKARALTEEVHKVRDQWILDFVEGFIKESVLRANLSAVGIGPVRVDYYVESARKRRDRDTKKDLLNLFKDGYLKDLILQEDFENRVYEIIVIPDVADIFIQKAYVRKWNKPKPPKETSEDKALKEANKYRISYARVLFHKYAIDKNEFIDLLKGADVDPAVAMARADYEEAKRPIEKPTVEVIARLKEGLRTAKLNEKIIIEKYKADEINENQFLKELKDLGYSDELAVAIVQLEFLRRR